MCWMQSFVQIRFNKLFLLGLSCQNDWVRPERVSGGRKRFVSGSTVDEEAVDFIFKGAGMEGSCERDVD